MVDFPITSVLKIVWGWMKDYRQKKKLIKKVRAITVGTERKITGATPIPHPPVNVEEIRCAIYKNMLKELEEFANEVPNTLMVGEVLELRKFIRDSQNILSLGTPSGMNFYDARFRKLRNMKWMR